LAQAGEMSSRNVPKQPAMEICGMWLQKLYGIHIDTFFPPAFTPGVPSFESYFVYDYSDPANVVTYEYPAIQHMEAAYFEQHSEDGLLKTMLNAVRGDDGKTAYEKIKELEAQGKKVDWEQRPSTALKQFLSKLRTDVQLPEIKN